MQIVIKRESPTLYQITRDGKEVGTIFKNEYRQYEVVLITGAQKVFQELDTARNWVNWELKK